MTIDSLFNREILLVSKHEKEKVLAPLFFENFNSKIVVSSVFNTDSLGSFSGEISRKKSAIETVKLKACLGSEKEIHKYDLILASEGSFGNHPQSFFLPAGEEFLHLKDVKNSFEITIKHFTTEVNFAQVESKNLEEIIIFAREVGFPKQGIILKNKKTIIKDLESFNDLKIICKKLLKQNNKIHLETDMRAHRNPTRMKEIGKAGEKLIQALKTTCPKCQTPGFQVTHAENGLPCEQCSAPTKSTLKLIVNCLHCKHEEEKYYPNNKKKEDAQFCDFCNP